MFFLIVICDRIFCCCRVIRNNEQIVLFPRLKGGYYKKMNCFACWFVSVGSKVNNFFHKTAKKSFLILNEDPGIHKRLFRDERSTFSSQRDDNSEFRPIEFSAQKEENKLMMRVKVKCLDQHSGNAKKFVQRIRKHGHFKSGQA